VWTDSWLSIVGAGCGLTGVGQENNNRERSSPVRPPCVEKTSRLRSRDPVASGVKCGPHGGMNSKMQSWTVSWLSLKTKVDTTWEPSHEWRLAEATPSSRGFQWFTRKPLGSLVDPQSQDRTTEDGAAAAPDRSDRWVSV
jgi:hypothetical protein